MSVLFSSLRIRDVEVRNRIFMSPMCQYSAIDGVPQEWHHIHLGSRAVGGVGLVMVEATAVSPEGRISDGDTGIWNNSQVEAFKRITSFVKAHGATPAIQLAHAGRKGSTYRPWLGAGQIPLSGGGWQVLAPSELKFLPEDRSPTPMSRADMDKVIEDFGQAAFRAHQSGFEVIEIHMAHGYLLHEFLSPLSNHRSDDFGGSFTNRIRFPVAVIKRVREYWPAELPVFVRISATDWVDGGWALEESVEFVKKLQELGVDLIDVSTGGIVASARIPAGPGFQVPFAREIRSKTRCLTGAVGLITSANQAEEILVSHSADAIFIGRQLLRDPYFAMNAASELGCEFERPSQYLRAK